MKFGIVITVYRRKDGKSPWYLKRCLRSIKTQIHQDYEVVIIGDNYTDDSEIKKIIPNHFYYENNPVSYERSKYTANRLWHCGGLKSLLYGISKLTTPYTIMLDYDDYWTPTHLKSFADLKEFDFACTLSTYMKLALPRYTGKEAVVPMLPKPCGMVKSSVCWNRNSFDVMPRNVYEETGNDSPTDADFLRRLAEQATGKKCYFINRQTCFHDTEGYCKTEFNHAPIAKISVVIICYNQQDYIRKALDSVLSQKTKHDLEIIVSDDNSTDDTPKIIEEYVTKHPIIKFNRNKENLGVTKNYQKAFSFCTGDYIAFCEGDDWWCDPEKIDKQVMYMIRNNDCSACYHQFHTYNQKKQQLVAKATTIDSKKNITQLIRDLVGANFTTIMAKKSCVDKIDPEFYNQLAYDWLFLMALAEHGSIGFMGKSLTVRRTHDKGVWSGLVDKMGCVIKQISNYDHFFHFKYTEDFQWLYKQKTQGFCKKERIPLSERKTIQIVEPEIIPEKIPVLPLSSKKITAITCTGDRPEAFNLCKLWMSRQTVQPIQWIIVDDGQTPLIPPDNCHYIRRTPQVTDPAHTLCLNLQKAFEVVQGDHVVFFEDDDWYSPQYIHTMIKFLNQYDMAGVGSLVFYSLRHPGWNYRERSRQPALYQTVFNLNVLPFLKHLCQSVYQIKGLAEKGLLDGQVWQQTGTVLDHNCVVITESFDSPMGQLKKGMTFYPPFPPFIERRIGTPRINYGSKPIKKYIHDPEKPIAVGIKNMPGRKGLTQAQKSGLKFYTYDNDCKYLHNLIGDDIHYYKEFINADTREKITSY